MLKYRLKKGESFDVGAVIRARLNLFQKIRFLDESVEFVVRCNVAEKRKEVYTLKCQFSGLKFRSKGSILSRIWAGAVGDEFVVRKDSRGIIFSVKGGDRLKKILFGFPLETVLLWFGGILSSKDGSNEWNHEDEIFVYRFRNSRPEVLRGKTFPKILVKCKAKNTSIVSNFQCDGELMFDEITGRIAVSKKELACTLFGFMDVHLEIRVGNPEYLK